MQTVSQEKVNAYSNKSVQPSQLPLPTGPFTSLRGGRRERTDEDRAWYSKQLAVQHVKRIDKLVFERLSFYGSLNNDRTAYPSVERLAREALCSARSVQYALRGLESAGLIECLDEKGGRATSLYRVVGSTDYTPGVQTVHPRGANLAPNVLREGKKRSTKSNPRIDTVQAQDHGETDEGKTVNLSLFPSLSQEQEKASAPVTENHAFPKVVALWCALRRKLGLEVNHTMETELDKLPHRDNVRIINDLEARERELVYQGRVAPPPITKPKSMGYLPPKAVAAADEALHRATCQHVPAADLPINCDKCGAYIGMAAG